MDILTALEDQSARTTKMVSSVQPDQLGLSTPCTQWDVRGLINHLCLSYDFCARVATGDHAQPEYERDFLGDDPAGAYARERDAMLAACSDPGLAERTVHMMDFGEMPGAVVPLLALTDTVVHRWDLAKAIGADPDIDDEVATMLLEQGRPMIPDEARAPSADETTGSIPFGPIVEVGDDAPPADKLVAFLGRTP